MKLANQTHKFSGTFDSFASAIAVNARLRPRSIKIMVWFTKLVDILLKHGAITIQ